MFIPAHCPNPECEHYRRPLSERWYYTHGYYLTRAFGAVPRFRCKSCGSGFSSQTFSIDYYAKRALDYRYIHDRYSEGISLRKIGRDLHASCDSVADRIRRTSGMAIPE